MTDRWYYWSDAEVLGPFSARQLADLAATGQILPTDTVWKDGVERGVPARQVRNLFPEAPPSSEDAEAPIGGAVASPSPAESPAVEPVSAPPAGADRPRWDAVHHPTATRARAVAGKGAILVGQDGTTVKFRKKCTTCGHEDSSWKTIPIPRGTIRVTFYCPKCRKQRHVEISGQMC